jgi:hypothetical protein
MASGNRQTQEQPTTPDGVSQLRRAAREFLDVAPYDNADQIWLAEGMRRTDPAIAMYSPKAGWNFTGEPKGSMWNLVQQERPDSLNEYFIRVATHNTPGTMSEFYARVGESGTMTYRTETGSQGATPAFTNFVQLIGVEPGIYVPGEAPAEAAFDPSITELRSGMRDTERPFSPDQASRLADYLLAHMGGEQLST